MAAVSRRLARADGVSIVIEYAKQYDTSCSEARTAPRRTGRLHLSHGGVGTLSHWALPPIGWWQVVVFSFYFFLPPFEKKSVAGEIAAENGC